MSDPRESPEWAEYEQMLSDLLISACADEDSMPEDDGRYSDDLFDERHAALDAFVLRLLERREPIGYAEIESTEWTGREYLTRLQWVTLGIPVAMQFALHPVEP